tara:strand:- start:16027 stop:17136 length:1110 start_codon:yes stop_codon:yes gene_type:complete
MNFIPIASPRIQEEEAKAAYEVVKSGWISMGKKVQEFEKSLCEYTGAKYGIAMNNGTSTLHSILMALNIGPGDEVIIPSLTYISSANVVLYQGATPIFCDNDPLTYNVTTDHIRKKITPKTKAFMTVDLKGLPVDYDSFNELSEETGIPHISDSAESLGSIYKEKKVGTQAFAHSFSFFANKNITTGEGGMVVTNNKELNDKLVIIRNQGQEGRYNHTLLGNNFRMTDILAAIGIEQIKKIDSLLNKKVSIAENYSKAFNEIDGIEPPFVPNYVNRPSWYMYSIRVNPLIQKDLIDYMTRCKIDTRLSFPPIHIQPFYKNKFNFKVNSYSKAYDSFKSFIDIPIWADMGNKNQSLIIDKIKNFMNNKVL